MILSISALAFLAACAQSTPPSATLAVSTSTAPAPEEAAQAFIETGDLQEAAEIWLDFLEDNPTDAAGHFKAGLILSILTPSQAGGHLEQAAELDPRLTEKATRMQDALRQAGSINDAAYQLTVKGQALASIEEWTLAQTALEMAVEENPQYAEAWAYLGEVRQQNQGVGSLEALQTAHELDPESYAANLFLSIYWNRNRQPSRALPYLRTAIEIDPNNLTLKENLAQTLVDAGSVDLGFEQIEALTDQYPERSEVWQMLARLSIENTLKVETVGLPAARQAVLLDQENPAATLLLGRAYLLTENAVMAERFFAKTIQQDPELADPHLYLAIIYLNQENHHPAEQHLQNAILLAGKSGNLAVADQAEQLLNQFFP